MSRMTHVYRIATLNINGITSQTKMAMLADFVTKQDIDVLLLQEVSTIIPVNFGSYVIHYNIGTSGRGTAILSRAQLELREILRLPSGRGMAADMQGVWLINVYAPSGAGKRQEREEFFILEVPYLMRPASTSIILGGEFNCVLDNTDITGHYNYRVGTRLPSGECMGTGRRAKSVYTLYTDRRDEN
jgi:exonuclease III